MKNISFYLIFLVVGVIIVLVVLPGRIKVYSIREMAGKDRISVTGGAKEAPKMEINNFKLMQTSGKKKQWELVADRAIEYESGNEVQIYNAVINFFKNDKLALILKADQGLIYLGSSDIKMRGNVNAVTPDSMSLITDSLTWLSRKEKLVTDDKIVITRGGTRIEGIGLEADPGLGKLNIKKDVHVKVPRD